MFKQSYPVPTPFVLSGAPASFVILPIATGPNPIPLFTGVQRMLIVKLRFAALNLTTGIGGGHGEGLIFVMPAAVVPVTIGFTFAGNTVPTGSLNTNNDLVLSFPFGTSFDVWGEITEVTLYGDT